MAQVYIVKLGLKVQSTKVGAKKINDSTLKMFGMVLVNFLVKNKLGLPRSF